jgi:hypothetical protein
MRTLLALVLGLLSSCSTAQHVASASKVQPASVVTPLAQLAPFAPLIGGVWSAPFNADIHDEQQFEWLYGGKFVRNVHQVKTTDGKVVYEGETIYAWDARASKIAARYWNATGGFVDGEARWDGAHMEFEGDNHAGGSQTERVRSVTDFGGDEWTMTGYFWKNGAWVEQGKRTYRRVP